MEVRCPGDTRCALKPISMVRRCCQADAVNASHCETRQVVADKLGIQGSFRHPAGSGMRRQVSCRSQLQPTKPTNEPAAEKEQR